MFKEVSQERLKELWVYDPETGLFRHRKRHFWRPAGTINKYGYLMINLDYKPKFARSI